MKFYNTTGSFDSPPKSTRKLDCAYQIEQPIGYVIELIIKTATDTIPFGPSCLSGYVEVSMILLVTSLPFVKLKSIMLIVKIRGFL